MQDREAVIATRYLQVWSTFFQLLKWRAWRNIPIRPAGSFVVRRVGARSWEPAFLQALEPSRRQQARPRRTPSSLGPDWRDPC